MSILNLVDLKMGCCKCHRPVTLALNGVGEQLRVVRCEGCGALIVLDPDFVPTGYRPAKPLVRPKPMWRDRRLAA